MKTARPAIVTVNYDEAIAFLYGLRLHGVKLGLENMHKLAELAGAPHRRLRFIHVAGSNGKGSTCAMLESIYRQSGLRTGLYTSPHLVRFGERIQVNRRPLSREQVVQLVEQVRPLLRHFPEHAHPTFFEVVTLMALLHFAESDCEVVLWETGLGGRFDATNIVTPVASVITNIALEHREWLGDTLGKVAAEKAGIIKPGVPVITATEQEEALEVIAYAAREHKSPLVRVTRADLDRPPLDRIRLGLLGEHQRLNAAVALATVRVLQERWPVSEETIVRGLQTVDWPGRLQHVRLADGRELLIDGAHNPAGAACLRDSLEQLFPARPRALLFGSLRDKDCRQMCHVLAPLGERIYLAPVESDRTASPEELAAYCREAHPEAQVHVATSLDEALRLAQSERYLVVTGSLYFIGQVMERLGVLPGQPVNERALNERVDSVQTANQRKAV